MSHVAAVELEVSSLADLETACKILGLTYLPNETDWRWFGKWMADYSDQNAAYKNGIAANRYGKADAGIIQVPGAQYDVGVYKHPTKPGKFVLVYDNWNEGMGIERAIGKGLVKLKERYGATVAKRTLTKQGYRVIESTNKQTGRLVLRAVK